MENAQKKSVQAKGKKANPPTQSRPGGESNNNRIVYNRERDLSENPSPKVRFARKTPKTKTKPKTKA